MSAYRRAIDETSRTIGLRARYFRNLVVLVVAIGASVPVAAVATGSWAALGGWVLLVPACGLFFYLDSHVLNRWRAALLAAWIAHDVEIEILTQSLRSNPVLPKGTLEGMLATLPSAGDLVAEQQLLAPTRRAIAAASLALHRDAAEALLLKTIASGITACALLAAIWTRAWLPLVALTAIALVPPAHAWHGGVRRKRLAEEVAGMRTQPGFSEPDYRRIEARLR